MNWQTTLLKGIVGSTAYGLDREGSDIDHLGIFSYSTMDLVGLDKPDESFVTKDPDTTMHEIGKYLRLALKCNPTILELMWLDSYEAGSFQGSMLIDIRTSFLSTPYVRNAYGGYATEQIRRLVARDKEGKTGFAADLPQRRVAKHARHCFRLLAQGQELLETASLTIKVPDPTIYWAFDLASTQEIVDRFNERIAVFNACPSILAEKPDISTVKDYLGDVRRAML